MSEMKKFAIQFIGLLIVIFAGIFITRNTVYFKDILGTGGGNEVIVLKVNNTKVNVEVADTQAKKAKGLAGREELATDSGMLFVYDKPSIYKFWMKGMKIPLDFIWIKDERIVDLLIDVPPPKGDEVDRELTIYQPKEPVNKILEVNGGFINNHEINIGDKIELVKPKSNVVQ